MAAGGEGKKESKCGLNVHRDSKYADNTGEKASADGDI